MLTCCGRGQIHANKRITDDVNNIHVCDLNFPAEFTAIYQENNTNKNYGMNNNKDGNN